MSPILHLPDGSPHPAPASVEGAVIFGTGEIPELAAYCLTHDGTLPVVAFTVDARYRDAETFAGRPLVALETLTERYPPERFALHLPIGWRRMNALRAEKLAQARALGYPILSYIASGTGLWPDFDAGMHCMIYRGSSISPFVRIGANVSMYGSVRIGHHCMIEDDCFLAAQVTVCSGAVIGAGSVLGAGSLILDGVRVAPRTFVGAGTIISRDTRENAVYTPAPARRHERVTAMDLTSRL